MSTGPSNCSQKSTLICFLYTNLMTVLAHKTALNPTRSQEHLLWEHVGYARFAANRAIEDFREGLADDEWRDDRTLRPRWSYAADFQRTTDR